MIGRIKPRRDEATHLPFVSEESFWVVTPSGDSDQDYETGKGYALMIIDYSVQVAHSDEVINCVLRAIFTKPELDWLEFGFIAAIVRAARRYRRSLLQGELVFVRGSGLWPLEPSGRPAASQEMDLEVNES